MKLKTDQSVRNAREKLKADPSVRNVKEIPKTDPSVRNVRRKLKVDPSVRNVRGILKVDPNVRNAKEHNLKMLRELNVHQGIASAVHINTLLTKKKNKPTKQCADSSI